MTINDEHLFRSVFVWTRVQVFVGNLPPEAEARALRDFFRDFGQINDAWVARKPPGFGFVWFDDERDAVFPTFSRHASHYRDASPPPACSLARHSTSRRAPLRVCT